MNWGKIALAVIYDALDAFNIIPGISDIIELFLGGSVAYALTGNPKATIASAIDGIIPAPFDIFPTTTVVVIADELGLLD